MKEEITQQLGFCIPIFNEKLKDSFFNDIAEFFSNNAVDSEVIIFSDKNNVTDKILQNKKTEAYIESKQIKVVELSSRKKLFDKVLEHLSSKYLCVLDPEDINNASRIANWYKQNKNQIHNDTVYSIKSKTKNKKSLNAMIASIVMPVKAKALDAKIFVMHYDIAQTLLPDLRTKIKDLPLEIPFKSKLKEINHETLELKNVKATPAKLNFLQIKYNYFAIRLNWFVKLPIRQTFCKDHKTKLSLWNGKHPLYRLLFFTLTFFALFFMPIMSFDYGITWDEPEDHEYFVKVYDYHATGGEDESCLDMSKLINTHLIYYGPLVNLTCVVADKYISPYGLYETRHIIISLFGFLAMLFAGLLAKRIGNWKTGFFAFLFLFLTPFFFASSMNNQKDIPFAAMYIMSAYYIIQFIKQLPRPSKKTIVSLMIVVGLTLSVRIAGLLMIAYLGLFMGIYWIIYTRKHTLKKSRKLIFRFLFQIIIISIVAYIIGIILWPFALQDPIKNPYLALTQFESFSLVHIWELFEGDKTYMQDFPWYYLPKFMLITIPLFVLAGIAMAIIGLKSLSKKHGIGMILMLFFLLVFPVVYIIYKQSALYSMWRHVYFVYPIVVIIAVLGWNWLLNITKKQKAIRIMAAVILALLIIKPTIWSIRNHPYQYVYYNEIVGGVEGAYGYYETDYWCQSPREAMEWLLENKPITEKKTIIATNNEPLSASYYAKKVTDSVRVIWARPHEWHKKKWDYAIWTTRTLPQLCLKNGYFPPKGTIHTIDVDGIPLAAIVKRENDFLYQAEKDITKRNYKDAIKVLEKAIKYDSLEEASYRNLGLVYLMQRNYEKSEYYLRKAIEFYPPNAIAYYFLALQEFHQKNYEEAINNIRFAHKYKINLSVGYSLLADIYFTQKKYKPAIRNYRKFMQYQGPNAIMFNQIGKVYLALENPQEAIKNFKMALRYNKNMAEAYYNMGYAYSKLGDKQKSQQYLNKAKQMMGEK